MRVLSGRKHATTGTRSLRIHEIINQRLPVFVRRKDFLPDRTRRCRGAVFSTIRPKVAIVSAGFENRWGFPKEDIVNAWVSAGAEVLNTATSGAISYRICRDDGLRRLGLHRQKARNYWN